MTHDRLEPTVRKVFVIPSEDGGPPKIVPFTIEANDAGPAKVMGWQLILGDKFPVAVLRTRNAADDIVAMLPTIVDLPVWSPESLGIRAGYNRGQCLNGRNKNMPLGSHWPPALYKSSTNYPRPANRLLNTAAVASACGARWRASKFPSST